MTDDLAVAARSWMVHLRDGGTTEWSAWARRPASDVGSAGSALPGAAQLELLRRINVEGPLPHQVDHVLSRPGPGRGTPRRTLPWPPDGPPAPTREVLRVATGVLADLTARLPEPPRTPPAPRRLRERSMRRRPTFTLDGLPVTVADLRGDLAAAGLFEHRPRQPWFGRARQEDPDVLLLVVGPLADGLRQGWSRRVQEGSGRRWRRFVGSTVKRGELPGSADPLRTVEHWAGRVGVENIHVLTAQGLHEQVERVLGRRVSRGARRRGDPVDLGPAHLDVLRRVNSVLPFLVREPEQEARRAGLVALLAEADQDRERRLEVPAELRGWVEAAGVRVEHELRRTGCTVHGDLAELHRAGADSGVRLRGRDVLTVTVRMIHRVDATMAAAGGGGR